MSKPAVAVRGNKVAVAYLFNYPKAGSTTLHQHDVLVITGTLTTSGAGVTWNCLPLA